MATKTLYDLVILKQTKTLNNKHFIIFFYELRKNPKDAERQTTHFRKISLYLHQNLKNPKKQNLPLLTQMFNPKYIGDAYKLYEEKHEYSRKLIEEAIQQFLRMF